MDVVPKSDISGECIFELQTKISSNSKLRESNILAKYYSLDFLYHSASIIALIDKRFDP